jgi:5-methylcytosine-specific restriction endonuclease McrA
VEVLGLECFQDTCETPAEDSQIDHIIPAARGGPTRQWNGRPACGFHNRARNRDP